MIGCLLSTADQNTFSNNIKHYFYTFLLDYAQRRSMCSGVRASSQIPQYDEELLFNDFHGSPS